MKNTGGAVLEGSTTFRTWKLWATGLVLGEEGDTAFYVSDLYSLYILSEDIQPASPPATMSSPSTAIDRLYPSENVKQNNPLSPKGYFILAKRNQPRQ